MINRDHLYSSTFESIDKVSLSSNSVYFYKSSIEERSCCADKLSHSGVEFVGFKSNNHDSIINNKNNQEFSLKSSIQMQNLFSQYNVADVYIDISGFSIRECASLLNNIFELNIHKNINIIYAEPENYNMVEFKQKGVYYDLSEEIMGIGPLPGFERIFTDNFQSIFIPFLGFEGGRFAYIYETFPPERKNIIPIIGLAGFRPEYPFVSYWGNQLPLLESNAWDKIKFATANSIVDAFFTLLKIKDENQQHVLKIAPIGTKPHSLAAILFSLCFPKETELIYDNPIRKTKRTSGIGKVIITSVSQLIKDVRGNNDA